MTLPPKSRACFVAASNLGPEDTARFLELHEQYTKAGASPTEAAKTAAADLVAEIEQEAKDLGTIIGPVAPKAGRVEQVWDVVRNFDHAKARDAFMDAVTSHGGTSIWNAIQTQYAKVGIYICYDRIFTVGARYTSLLTKDSSICSANDIQIPFIAIDNF